VVLVVKQVQVRQQELVALLVQEQPELQLRKREKESLERVQLVQRARQLELQ
jgi:hypothetical protein